MCPDCKKNSRPSTYFSDGPAWLHAGDIEQQSRWPPNYDGPSEMSDGQTF